MAVAVGAIVVVVVGTLAFQQLRTPGGKTRQVRVAPDPAATTATTSAAAEDPASRQKFEAVYELAPDEAVKLVPPPWIPERLPFHRERISKDNTTGATALMIVQERNGTLRTVSSLAGIGGDTGGGYSVNSVLGDIAGLSPQEVDLPYPLMKRELRGDWVYRTDVPVEQRLAALMQVIAPIAGRTYELARRPLEREVIVVTGQFKLQPLPGTKKYEGRPTIHLFIRDGEPDALPDGVGGGTASIKRVLNEVSDITGYPVVFDTPLASGVRVSWRQQDSVATMQDKRIGPADARDVDALLANVAKQTSLELKRERRMIEMWSPATTSQP
ncbi:MAG: hypothetical protein QOF78_1583 [Phycisphaerales bacterium]|jgi:hypothetical protein|nr:hypothetical protein [Phycisphaerales bacterium]